MFFRCSIIDFNAQREYGYNKRTRLKNLRGKSIRYKCQIIGKVLGKKIEERVIKCLFEFLMTTANRVNIVI